MYQARAMVTNAKSAIEAIQIPAEYSTEIPAENSNEEVHTDWMELWYDGLGYCKFMCAIRGFCCLFFSSKLLIIIFRHVECSRATTYF